MLTEGGNVFKDAKGAPRTQRINLADIAPTVKWLEAVTGLPLSNNMLGSTGLKPSSGDLDLAVDSNEVAKDQLFGLLSDYVQRNGQNPNDWVAKSGSSVHFLTPIRGQGNTGFVQTDFMFLPKPDFSKFILRQDTNSEYKGATRNILINSMAKSLGYKLNQLAGIADRASNEIISDDPDTMAQMLLGPGHVRDDLGSVEKILAALKNDPKRDAKLADFRDHMQRSGTPIDESIGYTDVNWMARLRDRVVNQGMTVMINEGVRIEHPEDLVFDANPAAGLQRAITGLVSAAQDPGSNTIKWDGRPAVIFGRKPTGEFVLTDKAGFLAKGYDGLATSPEMIAQIMAQRGGERGELVTMYQKLFPLLRRAVPENFRGYIQGDLLYSERPPQQDGNWVFTPNTVTYSVPVNSDLGKKIAASQAAVVIHTSLDAPGGTATPIRAAELQDSPGMLILDPSLQNPGKLVLDTNLVKKVQGIIAQHGAGINRLFDPAELRNRKISDLPALMKNYINTRVRSGSYDNLVQNFGDYVLQKSPNKAPRIFEWANENKQAVAALFEAFLHISALKNDLVRQLDSQSQAVQASINGEPGHEGYVGQGLKFVDRMRFSQANFAKNNPDLA
jgi:Family of unknown function (DUF6267)